MKLLNLIILPAVLSLASAVTFANDPAPPTPTPPALTTEVVNAEGEHLVADSFSRTLYVFDPDIGQTTPKCEGVCAEIWPPFLLSPEEAAAVTAPLGTITRTNGKVQLTYLGRPVYTYAYDRSIGNDKGDGLGGVWHYIKIPPAR